MAINWLKNTNTLPEVVKTATKMSPNLLPTVTVAAKKVVKTTLTPEERAEGLKKAFAQKEDNIKAKTAFNNKGMSKTDVIKLQQDLIDAGFGELLGKGGADGKWGKNSQTALEAFQEHQIAKRANTYEMQPKSGQIPITNVKTQLATKFKKGGSIPNTRENVAIPNLPKKKEGSKIYIKPENKGKFTATKKKTGKSTEELTHSKNPVTKKRAVFAQNAAKWKHEKGGAVEKYKFDPTLPNIAKKQKGGVATADSTKYYSKQMTSNIKEHFDAKGSDAKADAAKKVTQSKNNLARQTNKGKSGFDKNGFPIKSNQRGGTVGEGPKEGDTAAVYKKGNKVGKKQVGGAMGSGAAAYGAAKKGAKLPEKKSKIDTSKWKK